jgi:hypothetical protein
VLTVCYIKIWAHSAILCVNRMRPKSNAPLVAITLTEFVCGLNRMRTHSIRHFWIDLYVAIAIAIAIATAVSIAISIAILFYTTLFASAIALPLTTYFGYL